MKLKSLLSSSGRKKKGKAETYSSSIAKKSISDQGKVPSIACKHSVEKVCQASALSTEELIKINRALYSIRDKTGCHSVVLVTLYTELHSVSQGLNFSF